MFAIAEIATWRGANPQPGAVPEEVLQPVAAPVGEHGQGAGGDRLLELPDEQRLQAAEALAQVARVKRREHLQTPGVCKRSIR